MHARQATRRLVAAASVALAAACGGGTTGVDTGLPPTALLALARFDSAPPTNPATCVFHNNVLFTCTIAYADSVHTLFASISFSPHSIVSRNDTLLCDSCAVAVTVSFGRYDDPTVYTQSSRYASATVEHALELRRERTPHHWVEGRNSSHSGPAAATSALERPGSYLVGALK